MSIETPETEPDCDVLTITPCRGHRNREFALAASAMHAGIAEELSHDAWTDKFIAEVEDIRRDTLAQAQIHATLAVAAATVATVLPPDGER